MSPIRWLCLAVCALSACSDSDARAHAARAPNVVLICLDTVRADHVGAYGYRANPTTPALDRLATESTVFLDASAAAGWTKPSVPSFLTGTYPMQHGVYEGSARGESGKVTDVLPESSTTLAEVFRERGYATAAFVKNAQLNRGNGFEQGFETYVDEAGDARTLRWRAEDWLEEHAARSSAHPFFLYLHFLDAHWPYDVPDEYAARFTPLESSALFRGGGSRALRDEVNDGKRRLNESELAALVDTYDGSLRFIDDELARLFAYLDARGLWSDSVVCVIADHGEEFMEHGRIGHGHGLHQNLLRVPFIVRVPGRAPQRVDTPVSLIDLFPTLLGAAGLSNLPANEGLDRLREPLATRPILAEHKDSGHYQQALRAGQRKLVRRLEPLSTQTEHAVEPAAPAVGSRWEAELDPSALGLHLAKRMNARDDAADDGLELKGVLDEVAGDELVFSGFRAKFDARTELYGTVPRGVASAAALTPGLGIKIVAVVDAGALLAKRVKVYALGETFEPEVRGTVTAFEGHPRDGRVQLGGVWIELASSTRWEGLDAALRAPELARDELARVLAELDPQGPRANVRESRRCIDLGADPGELAPDSNQACEDMLRALDALGVALSKRRYFGAGDRKSLGADALRGLEHLGYVR